MLSGPISESLPVRSGGRFCPKDKELRCENLQLAYHQTPPCNMYRVCAQHEHVHTFVKALKKC